MQGKIVFLNGTSSAGKTTLAYALQELAAEPWLHIALDQFRDGLPAKYRGLNSPPGTTGAEGMNVVPVSGTGEPFTTIRFGGTGRKMLQGMRRAIRAMAESGNNVILDDIVLEAEFLWDYLNVFDGLEVTFVGVRCPIDIINEREATRPGRFPGTAQGHMDICHAHDDYDIQVDTSIHDPHLCASMILGFLDSGEPGAFGRIRARRKS